jgi:tryptophan-rich sensory protein
MTKQARNLVSFSIALFLPQLVGILSSVAAGNSVSTWYRSLKKPVWNPPGWIFAPVWTLLYGLMGLASWLVWKKREDQKDPARTGLKLYGVQLTLNSLWSLIFFGARRVNLALVEIVSLWAAILVTIIKFALVDRRAAWLMIPYQLWVSFALILNAAIWWLNRPRPPAVE